MPSKTTLAAENEDLRRQIAELQHAATAASSTSSDASSTSSASQPPTTNAHASDDEKKTGQESLPAGATLSGAMPVVPAPPVDPASAPLPYAGFYYYHPAQQQQQFQPQQMMMPTFPSNVGTFNPAASQHSFAPRFDLKHIPIFSARDAYDAVQWLYDSQLLLRQARVHVSEWVSAIQPRIGSLVAQVSATTAAPTWCDIVICALRTCGARISESHQGTALLGPTLLLDLVGALRQRGPSAHEAREYIGKTNMTASILLLEFGDLDPAYQELFAQAIVKNSFHADLTQLDIDAVLGTPGVLRPAGVALLALVHQSIIRQGLRHDAYRSAASSAPGPAAPHHHALPQLHQHQAMHPPLPTVVHHITGPASAPAAPASATTATTSPAAAVSAELIAAIRQEIRSMVPQQQGRQQQGQQQPRQQRFRNNRRNGRSGVPTPPRDMSKVCSRHGPGHSDAECRVQQAEQAAASHDPARAPSGQVTSSAPHSQAAASQPPASGTASGAPKV